MWADIKEHMPVRIFEAITPIASITNAEHRLMSWLISTYWKQIVAECPEPERLHIAFIAESELAVHWTGAPTSARRTVMICHTDREGYVLGGATRTEDASLVVEGMAVVQEEIYNNRRHAPLSIVCDSDEGYVSCPGRLEDINVLLNGEYKEGAVIVRISVADVRPSIVIEALNKPQGAVTARHTFQAFSDRAGCRLGNNGEILSWSVDNAAGVAACTAVLTKIITERAAVNVSVIYTTGEERGMIGVLRVIASDHLPVFNRGTENLWIVVDSSSCPDARIVGLDEWRRARLLKNMQIRSRHVVSPNGFGTASAHSSAVIRLEDKLSIFDLSSARMLYQAAMNVRGGLPGKRHAGKRHDEYHMIEAGVTACDIGQVGVFLGGVCEASMLAHMNDLRLSVAKEERLGDRVGSIAIPILNYRNMVPDRSVLLPEEGHIGALNSCAIILEQACHMHLDYAYSDMSPSGYRGATAARPFFKEKTQKSRTALVEHWRKRLEDMANAPRTANQEWIKQTGLATVRAMQPRRFLRWG